MKKTMMLLLCLLIVVSLFATTALAAAITPRGSEGAAWTNKTIRQTSAIIAEGEKSDTGKADVYITKTDYPYNTTGMAVRIYDKTDREEATSWKTYYYWASTSTHQYTNIAYNSGRAISGHTYILNLKIPASSSITALECSGVFYP